MRFRPIALATGLAVACLLVGSLTACAIRPIPSPTGAGSATRSPVPHSLGTPDPTTPPFGGEQGTVPAPDQIKNVPDLRKTVVMTGCRAAAGGWEGFGTASTTSATSQKLVIVVIFTDAQARDITSSTITIDVGAGQKVSWTAAAKFTPPDGVACVLAGVGYA